MHLISFRTLRVEIEWLETNSETNWLVMPHFRIRLTAHGCLA